MSERRFAKQNQYFGANENGPHRCEPCYSWCPRESHTALTGYQRRQPNKKFEHQELE